MCYLKTFTSGPVETNCYLLGGDNSSQAILADAPPDCYEGVMKTLNEDERSLAALLITHPHFDHVLDAAQFAANGVPVFALQDAVEGIACPETMFLMDLDIGNTYGTEVSRIIKGGEQLTLAGLDFMVFEVPGHSVGSAAFYVRSESLCLVGDAIFKGSVGRTDLPGGDFKLLAASIRYHIYTLSNDTVLLPGHGPPTDVGSEKHGNPYVCG